MKLNLGCGSQVIDGWCNVDYSWGARLIKIPLFRLINKKLKLFNMEWNNDIYLHDLTKRFPWPDSSVDIVYSSHTLEHFSKSDGRKLLNESYRVLRKDGIIRIVVPSLSCKVNDYIEGKTQADDFIEHLGVLYGSESKGFKKLLSPYIHFPHKCMYDNKRLIEILNEIGFTASTREPFDSDIEDIRIIELADRTTNTAVIVEGRKL